MSGVQWPLVSLISGYALLLIGNLCALYVVFFVSRKSFWLAYLSLICGCVWLPVAFFTFKHKQKTLIVGAALVCTIGGLALLFCATGGDAIMRLEQAGKAAVNVWKLPPSAADRQPTP